MGRSRGMLAVVTVIGVASVGVSACGSSSKSKAGAIAPAGPTTSSTLSTPSAVTTTAASGPLTKTALRAASDANLSASAPWFAALRTGDPKQIGAAAPKQLAAQRSFVAQVSALKAPSPAAATEQRTYVSLLNQQFTLLKQFAQAAAANDLSAAQAVQAKLHTIGSQLSAAGNRLLAAIPK